MLNNRLVRLAVSILGLCLTTLNQRRCRKRDMIVIDIPNYPLHTESYRRSSDDDKREPAHPQLD